MVGTTRAGSTDPSVIRVSRTAWRVRAWAPLPFVLAGMAALAGCQDPFITQPVTDPPAPTPTPTPIPPATPGGDPVVKPTPNPPPVTPPNMPPPAMTPPNMPPVIPPPNMPPPVVPPEGAKPPPPVPIAAGPKCDQADDPPPPPGAPPPVAGEEACPENAEFELRNWFPVTPEVQSCFPKPHPATECPFYQFGFQHFFIATQPDPQGTPAFLGWNTIENTFGEGAGKAHPAGPPILSAGITQAGQRQVLVDVNKNPIFYGIHFNKKFVDFVNLYQLSTVAGIKKAPPELQFPADVVELKSAWQIVPPGQTPNPRMVRATVRVPTLAVKNGVVSEDYTMLRTVTAQMLSIHVVYTIPGHPEFIWATFEAQDAQGNSLVAPSARDLPPRQSMTPFTQALDPAILGMANFALFPRTAPRIGLNTPVGIAATDVMKFNAMTQQFSDPTLVHRVYRGSLSHETDFDGAVVALNNSVHTRFENRMLPVIQQPNRNIDRRGFYTLLGAVWQDVPSKSFGTNKVLVNDPNDPEIIQQGPESPKSITGGEDRLSSTAMESFTQPDTSFPNCFSCHDTRSATAKGVPFDKDQGSPILIEAKQINVSHVFNEVVRLSGLGLIK
jgi:hypothetical protein